jgi:hypothetical protein
VREAAKWQGAATILGTAASIYGNIGGSGSSSVGSSSAGSSFNAPKSVSSSVGTNTTANWTLNSGYTFTPTKTVGSWGNTLNTGNFGRKNYFGYR